MSRMLTITANLCLSASAIGQNLLANPDFEQVPGNQQGQGILPSDWIQVQPSVDTYSNDGSYGLPPEGFGNFPGVIAFSGIRWIAGWTGIPEVFGQTMADPLVPGRSYTLRAWLRIAERADLRSPGTYEISLRGEGHQPVIVGRLGVVVYGSGWVERQLAFVAPAGAESRPVIAFAPVAPEGGSSYIGCDLVRLEEGCRADFDGDGFVTGLDFDAYVQAFEAGC